MTWSSCPNCRRAFEAQQGVNWRFSPPTGPKLLYCSVICLKMHTRKLIKPKLLKEVGDGRQTKLPVPEECDK